jgi:hypothetical protein
LIIEEVKSAAGSRKTRTTIEQAVEEASHGQKTMIAMPTLELIGEMVGYAKDLRPVVPVVTLASDPKKPSALNIERRITDHIKSREGGHLAFITHEGLLRVTRWPENIVDYHLVIDEALSVILTREPLKFRYSHSELEWFIKTEKMPALLEDRLATQDKALADAFNLTFTTKEPEELDLDIVEERRAAFDQTYYLVMMNGDFWKTELRAKNAKYDQVYALFSDVARWMIEGAPLFTAQGPWDRMVAPPEPGVRRPNDTGQITISGFRHPEILEGFGRVTVLSALFEHTMMYHLWKGLGVEFVPSTTIHIDAPTVPLGERKLHIYYFTDEPWSKTARNRRTDDGTGAILDLLQKSNAIDMEQPVCVVTNKDDASEDNPQKVLEYFPNAIMMPHKVAGQNRFREYHQLIYVASLNSRTPDIKWLENVRKINSKAQRIGRTLTEIYQAIGRLSLRDEKATHDITVIVPDKDIAELLVEQFSPAEQVELHHIDASGVISPRGRPGPKPSGTAKTNRERQAEWRKRQRTPKPPKPKPPRARL